MLNRIIQSSTIVTLLLAAVTLASDGAFAFTLIGAGKAVKGWAGNALELHVNPDNCPGEVDDLIDKAIAIWNEVPTLGILLKRGDDTRTTIDQALAGAASITPTVHCVTNMATVGLNPAVIPGVATGQQVDSQGHLNYGVLILNAEEGAAANVKTLNEELVVDVIAHEIGHILGLGHSSDTSALMYYDASKRKKASLAQDDVDGITYLYPRDELNGDNPFGGCAVIKGQRGRAAIDATLLALPAFLYLMTRFFQQRRRVRKA